jgi:hypothetical protein
MNAPISHAFLSTALPEKFKDYAQMPIELRTELLWKTLESAKNSTTDPARWIANRLQAQDFLQVLSIIDRIRNTAIENAEAIEAEMDHGRESTFNGILIGYLPNHYSIGGFEMKAAAFIALSDALTRVERPFIWVPAVSEMSTTVLKDQVAVQVEAMIWEPDPEIFEEPKNITLQKVRDMSLEEILSLDIITMRMLLENALDSMERLYAGQIVANIEDIWPSFDTDMPIDPAEQVTAWIGFIKGRLTVADMDHFGELKIFLAFKQLDHSHQLRIIEAMTPSEPLLGDVSSIPDPQQSTLF